MIAAKRKTWWIGTIMKTAKHLPSKYFAKNDPDVKNGVMGQTFFQHSKCSTLSALIWKDKADVSLLYSDKEVSEACGLCERGFLWCF